MRKSAELELSILKQIAIVLRDTGMPFDDSFPILYKLKKEMDQLINCVGETVCERIKKAYQEGVLFMRKIEEGGARDE